MSCIWCRLIWIEIKIVQIQVAAMADDRGLCTLHKSKIAETDPATHQITFYVIFV
jgi:hypothetical protein